MCQVTCSQPALVICLGCIIAFTELIEAQSLDQQVAEPGFEPSSPDCQAQVPLPWGPPTSVLSRDGQTSRSRSCGAQSCVLCVQIKEALPPPPERPARLLSTPQSGLPSRGFRGPKAKGTRHRGVGGGNGELTDTALF